ncbi:hypothetical protein M0813_27821 [Anaeramoeba flamelloides]|uniref:Uncharacterized protein n=1 Tax=Anaeramoeba flamelloides TaxID=1746091 RepID=A0ABQ8XWJ7_9EUKA|nr:hypothetical protein M0813_27821 [Anaeramoeba flamelloides]
MNNYSHNSNQKTEQLNTLNSFDSNSENTDLMLGELLIFMKYSKINQEKTRLCLKKELNNSNMNPNNMYYQNRQMKPTSKISSLSLLSSFLVDQNRNLKDHFVKKIPEASHVADNSNVSDHKAFGLINTDCYQENGNTNTGIDDSNRKSPTISFNNNNKKVKECKTEIMNDNNSSLMDKKLREDTSGNKISKFELKIFLNQKPKLSWGERLFYIKQYDKNLVQGHPELFYTKNYPIYSKQDQILIINKTIFPLIINLTKGITKNIDYNLYQNAYKSCQRGLIEWFRRKNYKNHTRYSRDKMEFHPNSFYHNHL